MSINKVETMISYFIGETSVLIGSMVKGESSINAMKTYLERMSVMPYETLENIKSLGYTAEDYAFGAIMESIVNEDRDRKISREELITMKGLERLLADGCFGKVVLSEGHINNSNYGYGDDTIYLGCKGNDMLKIMKKSSIKEVLLMTLLHENGHREDALQLKRLLELERIVEKNEVGKVISRTTGERLTRVVVTEKIFKRICKNAVRAEIAAWDNAWKKASLMGINKKDFDAYRSFALYKYVRAHHKRMINTKLKIADYLIEAR